MYSVTVGLVLLLCISLLLILYELKGDVVFSFCWMFMLYNISFLRFSEEISTEDNENKSDILNIFSVASGHLYERFLR